MKRGFLILASGLVLLLAGLSLASLLGPDTAPTEAAATGGAEIGGPFELVDETGRTVTDETFRGRWMLVFFGFTHCPDVCPTTLNAVAIALDRLGAEADRVQPLFITVDPERDTPAVLADYTAAFDDRILGLTGTPEQIAAAAKAYGVYYAKHDLGNGDYGMDHSAAVYLMRPDGGFVAPLSYQIGGEAMAEKIADYLESH